MDSPATQKIREPIVDGLLYPGDPTGLKEYLVSSGLSIPDMPGSSLGILTPHASYERCGSIIAKAFRAVEKRKIDTAILIGPVHREEEDALFLPESSIFHTPLGDLPVNERDLEDLFSSGTRFIKNDIPHLEEHCLELQLPFLAYHFPNASIVPILVGKPSVSTIQLLAHALKTVFASRWEKTLLIVTSNASGILPQPDAEKEVDFFLKLLEQRDWRGMLQERGNRRVGACGIGGIGAVLALFGSSVRFTPLARTFSLDEKEGRGVVYLSASIDLE